jgi:hypothetical protein
MSGDKPNRTVLPSSLREPAGRYGGALPPAEPDVGKLPALPYYERHPEHRPRRAPWRRSIWRRLMEGA